MKEILIYILLFLFNLALIPLFWTILKIIEARLSWKKWPRIFQGYYDLSKLLKKDDYKSEFTSLISFISPIIILTVAIIFLFFVPIIFSNNFFNINIIVLFHLLWLGSFFLILYWMDNATYFWWLWASREAFVLAIVEPILILMLAWLIVLSNWNMELNSISEFFKNNNNFWIALISSLFALVFFAIFLAENKRFPFDNPSTHLELTMIHEAMLLETSWKTLFIMELASKIIMFAFVNLFILLFWSNNYGITNDILLIWLWFIKIVVLLIFVWLFEVLITKMRLFKYQNVFMFLLMMLFLSSFFYFIK